MVLTGMAAVAVAVHGGGCNSSSDDGGHGGCSGDVG